MGIKVRYYITSIFLMIVFIIEGKSNNQINNHEYVDLGLSVNWATCNIGSECPEGFGEYFAWGEIYPKSCYNIMTYKFAGETLADTEFNTIEDKNKALFDFTKYVGDVNPLNKDDVQLEISDDVAHHEWGELWRIPTKSEINKLIESCDWVGGEINGIIGYWAVSNINGNKIFLPLSGYINDDNVIDVGKYGKFWASELRKDMCFEAYQIWISPRMI